MSRVITSLCLRDSSCVDVCPVDCIKPGSPQEQYPTYYINPDDCIDCGACETECPHIAIFEKELVPSAFQAKGGEYLSKPVGTDGFNEIYDGKNNKGESIHLTATHILKVGEIVDLTNAIDENASYFSRGPGKDMK
jgi:ferredoxin